MGEREAPVGHEVAGDREQARRPRARPAASTATSDPPAAGRADVDVPGRRRRTPERVEQLAAGTDDTRGDAPRRCWSAARSAPSPGRTGAPPVRAGGGRPRPAPRRLRASAAQQLVAQLAGPVGREAVEVEAVVVASVEAVPVPIRTVVRPSSRWIGEAVSVDGADPVERRRQHVPVRAVRGAARPGRWRSGSWWSGSAAGRARSGSRPRAAATARRHRRRPGDEQADQHRQEADQLADRVDQQHPRVEPLPLGVADRRRRTRSGHVASPATASALTGQLVDQLAGRAAGPARRSGARRPPTRWSR